MKALAIHFLIQHPECCSASTTITPKNVTRKRLFFAGSFNQEFSRFDGRSFEQIGSTKVSHQDTLGLANYRGEALTVSCYSGVNCQDRTEILNMDSMRWINAQDYPYNLFGFGLYQYSTASTAEAAYIIGGGPRWSQTITEFKYDQWRKIGELFQGRMSHGSITLGAHTLIIGGIVESDPGNPV